MVTVILIIVIGICFISFIFSTFLMFRYYMKTKERNHAILNYEVLYAVLTNAINTAYDKTFKEEVLVLTSSGYRLNKEEMKKIRSKYIKNVFDLCGDSIIDDLELIHGTTDSLIIFLANDFTNKVLNDEADMLNNNNPDGGELMKGIGVNR